MANPKLSRQKELAIQTAILDGASNNQIASDLGVATGTVSNIRQGLVSSDAAFKKATEKIRSLTQQNEDALAEINKLQYELTLFASITDWARHFKPVKIQPKPSVKGSAVAVLSIGDWHFEEEVKLEAVNGLNQFNIDIARRRARALFASAASLVDMCKSRSNIDTLIINLLGDFINGWIHEEYMATNLMTPPEAILAVFEELLSGITFLASTLKLKEIIVPCVCGNHGRITKRTWSKLGVKTNYDWLLYNLLANWFAAKNTKNVRFVLPQGDMTYLEVYDEVIRVTHGDNIRYVGGIGGVHIPMRKAIDSWNTGRRADFNYFGHWHSDLAGEDYRIAGSLIGFNEYSIKIKARFRKPSQAFDIVHPKYGHTAPFPIILPQGY